MSKRLFSYSDDNARQAVEVAEILEKNNIEFYETPSSRWGFSHAAIWINNDEDFDRAKTLFEQHVKEFAQRAQLAYQEQTGYDPQAPWLQRLKFNLSYMFKRAAFIPLIIFGVGLVLLYLYLFQSLFS